MSKQNKTYMSTSAEQTERLGELLGKKLRGGEVIELRSDIGGGKTTFTRGVARGFGSEDAASSPSFTISYVYGRSDGKSIYHFDFYRLSEPGLIAHELSEVEGDKDIVTIVEWADIVEGVLPADRLLVNIMATADNERKITYELSPRYDYLVN